MKRTFKCHMGVGGYTAWKHGVRPFPAWLQGKHRVAATFTLDDGQPRRRSDRVKRRGV